MDMTAIGEKVLDFIKKYRYVILVLVIGIGLMALPDRKETEQDPTSATVVSDTQTNQTEALTQILSQIRGAGKVKVLLTVAAGERTVYQMDQDTATAADSGTVRHETVIVTDADRAQHGLVQQIVAPEYRGAIIVCQGADDPNVRLAIVEAVANATGLGTNRISVLKMK